LLGRIKPKYIDYFVEITYNIANFGTNPKKPHREGGESHVVLA
jgi:hypothetical protein